MKNIFYLISFRCNQFCSKCRHWKKPQNNEILAPHSIVNVLQALAPIDEFCIVGGEPLLFPKAIVTILSETVKMVHRTVIVTNGVLLTPDLVDELSQHRIHIVVSVDTLDRIFWQYVRGVDSYDQVMRNLDYAYKSLSPDQLSIQSVVSKETEPYLADVHAFCNERGLHHSLQNYVQDGFDGEWTALDSNDRHHQIEGLEMCFAAGRNLSIDPQGNVKTCFQQSLIPGCVESLGSLKTDSIENILSTSYAKNVQKAMTGCSLPCRVLRCNQEN